MIADPRAVESLLAFWADAGVDACFEDEAVDRMVARAPTPIAAPRAVASPQAATSKPQPERVAAPEPVSLDAARHLASGAQNLDALAAMISDYEGCPLKTMGARRSVFSRGVADAPVMVIGEGPGGDEDAQGLPFVGRAGKLLDKMLAAAGLEGRVFITNTVFWRPPGNRTPTLEEQRSCLPFLERAIALVNPQVLLLVGGAATKSLLGQNEGILALRGRWFQWPSVDLDRDIPALATLHPAFLLRQPTAKKKAWSDLLLLAERVGSKGV